MSEHSNNNTRDCYGCFQCFSQMPHNVDVEWEIGDKCRHLGVINISLGNAPDKYRYICTLGYFNRFSRIRRLS